MSKMDEQETQLMGGQTDVARSRANDDPGDGDDATMGRVTYPSGTIASTVHAELFDLPVRHDVLEAMGFAGPHYEVEVAPTPVYIIPDELWVDPCRRLHERHACRAYVAHIPEGASTHRFAESLGIEGVIRPSSRIVVLQSGTGLPVLVHEATHLLRSRHQLAPRPLSDLAAWEWGVAEILAAKEVEANLHETIYRIATSPSPSFTTCVLPKWEQGRGNRFGHRLVLDDPTHATGVFIWDEITSAMTDKPPTPEGLVTVLRDKNEIIRRVKDRYLDGPLAAYLDHLDRRAIA